MANNQFVYKPSYELKPFQSQFITNDENSNDSKTQKLKDQQKRRQLQTAIKANYFKDLDDFINQGRSRGNNTRVYREDETPFVLRQFDRQLPKNQFYSKMIKKIKSSKKMQKNKYFS